MSRNVHLRDRRGWKSERVRGGNVLTVRRSGGGIAVNKRCITDAKEREKETGGRGMAGRSLGGGRSEGGLDGTCRFAKYKGELGDYDLPFVRSFQLFCPIKISIFSPITAALAGLPFAVSPALPRPPPPSPSSLVQPSHATLHTVASTVPNPP